MINILCFGDSNTHGCNPQCDIRDYVELDRVNPPLRYERNVRWPGVMQEVLGEGFHVIEEGLPGRTFMYDDEILPNRRGQDHIQLCMESHNPIDLLIIMLGTNDSKCLYGSKLYPFLVGVEEFLKIAKNPVLWQPGQKPNILLVAPPPLGENITNSYFYGMFDENSLALTKQFAEYYEKIAKAQGCHFLDAGQFAHADDSGDSIHFPAEDHICLGKGMADKVKEIFGL